MGKRLHTVLVLGFPAPLAHEIIAGLLEAEHTVYLIVDNDDFRLAAPLKKRFGKQLQLLVGNGAFLDYGLSGPDYLDLCQRVDYVMTVYSTALQQYDESFYYALSKELVEFCKAANRLKRVFYVGSFAFALGFDGMVAENDLDLPSNQKSQKGLGELRIEKVLRRFQETFPITVVRCGTIVGEAEMLCPLIRLALGFPDLFMKQRRTRIVVTSTDLISRFLISSLGRKTMPRTLHLFNEVREPRQLRAQLLHLAQEQVPQTYDLQASAKRHLKKISFDPRHFSVHLTTAKVENSWTNRFLREHSFSKCNTSLDWQPLVDSVVERLSGFK